MPTIYLIRNSLSFRIAAYFRRGGARFSCGGKLSDQFFVDDRLRLAISIIDLSVISPEQWTFIWHGWTVDRESVLYDNETKVREREREREREDGEERKPISRLAPDRRVWIASDADTTKREVQCEQRSEWPLLIFIMTITAGKVNSSLNKLVKRNFSASSS